MAVNWYVFENDEIVGPLSAAELIHRARVSKLCPTTRVRKGEDGQWVLAERVKGLWNKDAVSDERNSQFARHVTPATLTKENHTVQDIPVIRVGDSSNRITTRRKRIAYVAIALAGISAISAIILLLGRDDEKNVTKVRAVPSVDAAQRTNNPLKPNKAADRLIDASPARSESKPVYEDVYEAFSSPGTARWTLGVVQRHKDYPILPASQVAEQMKILGLQTKTAPDRKLIVRHSETLTTFFESLERNDVHFLYSKEPPVSIRSKDGQPCLLVGNLASTDIYNTLRLTEKQRAARTAESLLLPVLQMLDEHVYKCEIPFYCLTVYYGGKDFSSHDLVEEIHSLKSEMLAIVTSRNDCHAFAAGRISQETFLSKAEVFIASEELLGSTRARPRRVDLVIE